MGGLFCVRSGIVTTTLTGGACSSENSPVRIATIGTAPHDAIVALPRRRCPEWESTLHQGVVDHPGIAMFRLPVRRPWQHSYSHYQLSNCVVLFRAYDGIAVEHMKLGMRSGSGPSTSNLNPSKSRVLAKTMNRGVGSEKYTHAVHMREGGIEATYADEIVLHGVVEIR
ncbi:uncharacterized protein EI90DRAFT_3020721 [Cantharellus anzutake]|uniref:uncharacterized protein n=1 Tax=Cantharellus anzutake TaxID=1750568 RepID=UPI00190453EF|nr:uncharacterized protein EI90DRAFT_3020721 [Cantharellus anzutake]KAF8319871.1 hypothetical protein EI90DRAFT_3020721 [Cantharellus anzutake]